MDITNINSHTITERAHTVDTLDKGGQESFLVEVNPTISKKANTSYL